MDLEPFHRSVYHLMMVVTSVITSAIPISTTQAANFPPSESITISSNSVGTKESLLALSSSEFTYQLAMVGSPTEDLKPAGIAVVYSHSFEIATPEAQLTDKPAGPEVPKPTPTPTPKPADKDQDVLGVDKVKESTDSAKTEVKSEVAKTEDKNDPFDLPVKALASALNPETLMNLMNKHRADIGLPAFEKDDRLCKLADYRAPMLQDEIFGSGVMHAGLKALNLPYWVTENIAGYASEQVIFDFWMSDTIHRKAIESSAKYSCGACQGNSCAQEFSSFVPK